ncbi:DASH complex subunit DAM1 [Colletotrichum sidae]|uniref:DASH complex subunit DAM1 n=1 Tax=Colletotrichum sidae TaxID=1347389 RepID=A0A4R8T594_9PEZI|nr:DASH complex subunit DAM1 [Colletotrichum sidae]
MDQEPGMRSTSRTRTSRPTTPLRPSSRSSFRDSARGSVHGGESFPLNTFEPAFAELSDAMADLEANMMHFQLMHESLARFSESFASFLYGLNMNAFCVDFQEGPIAESFRRARQHDESTANSGNFAQQCCCLGMIRLMENITQHRFAHRKS